MRSLATLVVIAGVLASTAGPAAQSTQKPTFKASLNIVSVDVVVRDRSGVVVRGLTAKDFDIREDGRPQEVRTFAFQEIDEKAAPLESVGLLAGAEEKVAEAARLSVSAAAKPVEAPVTPIRSEDVAGRRLLILLFDVSSMQPEDVQRSVESAKKYVDEQMTGADLVAVATISSMLNVLTDFTAVKKTVQVALDTLAYTDGTATTPPEASTAAIDEAIVAAEEAAAAETSELELFNNDMRLRALKTLAETLQHIDQKKAIVYFSAGMERSGQDNQIELRAAINAAVRANVSIYSIDTRGLQAVVPGGDARQASGRGQGMFSGRGMAQQFARLSASQDSLSSLSADTGGRAFTDSNDFGPVFARVRRDISAYYLLGYSSENTNLDGRFRRIQVRLKDTAATAGYRIEARAGYYADRDFSHTAKGDRETQLQEQMQSPVASTDLPLIATAGYFRLSPDKYYVPIAMAVPGSAVPVKAGKLEVELDILGIVSDEQGRPVGRMRQTMKLPAAAGAVSLAGRQILYQSGLTLPPGRFSMKVVARENTGGKMGAFEAAVIVPQLNAAPLKVSAVVMSTQVQAAPRGRSDNPLVRDGVQLLPNLTRVVNRDQKIFFYYEVYDAAPPGAGPSLRTSLAFYRGLVKVFETPVVERTTIDAADRGAALFQFELPALSFEPGLYTCQINIIDDSSGKFAFPRLAFFVR